MYAKNMCVYVYIYKTHKCRWTIRTYRHNDNKKKVKRGDKHDRCLKKRVARTEKQTED